MLRQLAIILLCFVTLNGYSQDAAEIAIIPQPVLLEKVQDFSILFRELL